jgi:hypothetical protein
VRQEISAVEAEAAAAVGGSVVAAAGQEDRWAEEGNVQVGPEGSPVLEEGTSLEEGDRRTGEEERWGSREDQREDRSESCPEEEEEGNRKEGKVGVVEGPEDLGDRATAAAAAAAVAAVVAAGWAGGRRLEGQMGELEERRVRRGVLRPERDKVSVTSCTRRWKKGV